MQRLLNKPEDYVDEMLKGGNAKKLKEKIGR